MEMITSDILINSCGGDTMSNSVVNGDGKTSWYLEEAFELTGHGWYNYLALITCSIICMAVSLDIFGFSVVVDAATCDLELTIPQVGLLVSAPFVGLIFAYPWGYLADTRGRRLALLLSTSVGFVFGALSSFAVTWEMMFVAKIIGSSFSLSSFTLVIAYLGESVGSKKRSEYLSIMNSLDLGAEVVTFGLAYLILPLPVSQFITFRSWRLYTLLMSLPLGISALLLLFLHESPKFLAYKGEEKKALEILQKIYVANGGNRSDFPVKALKIVDHSETKDISFCGSLVRQTVPLFTPPLLWRTLQLFYLIILVTAICNVCLMWFPTMLDLVFDSLTSESAVAATFCESIVRNVTISSPVENRCDKPISEKTIIAGLLTSLFFGLLNLAVAKLAAWRRLVLVSAYVVSAVSCIMVVILKHPIASTTFFALIQTTGIGIGCIASYFVDLYPTYCRGLATSLGFMVARCVALVGVIVIGDILVYHCDFIFYTAALMVTTGIGVASLLPSDKQITIV